MRLKGIKDSIKSDMTIVFHSTRSREELADILLENKFAAGRGGGSMLGPGFYANQHLYQAKKHNYGQYILKARIYGIKNFLILDEDIYTELFGDPGPNFIWTQIERKGGLSDRYGGELTRDEFNKEIRYCHSTAQVAVYLWKNFNKDLKRKFGGFEYSGNWDKESVVCWYPERQVQPLGWSDDDGETWKPVKSFKDYEGDTKESNLKKSESIRSMQRAKDLLQRYANKTDAQLAKAINSQLARVASPAKKEQRKEAFIEALNKERPDVVPLIN